MPEPSGEVFGLTPARGCYASNKRGLSWSLKREVAERFPFVNRYRQTEGRPLLIKASVSKKSVIASKIDRDEAEIIANDVRIISIATAKDPQGQFAWDSKDKRVVCLDPALC